MKYQLTHMTDNQDISYEVHDFTCIGSEPSNHIVLIEEEVSARHARIEKTENGYVLKDNRSLLGTYVNERKALEHLLSPGDVIRIGHSQFMFEFSGSDTHDSRLELLRSLNAEWDRIVRRLPNYAKSDLPILILGESGVGKEIFSQTLHQFSRRKYQTVVTVNCSALTESLAESELFGHTKGSYTGATQDRKGAFEEARGGTLILDEVGDLPMELQPKLLRAIENKEIKPVGADRTLKTDCRLIACTHHNLMEKVYRGEFRLDLFYRLNVIQIKVPALRERLEDFEKILYKFAREMRVRFSLEAVAYLKSHSWPGNIRELKNVVSRCKIYYPGETIGIKDLESFIEKQKIIELQNKKQAPNANPNIIKEIEKELILKRLVANFGNQRQTARDLGIPKSTLYDRIRTYGLNIKDFTNK